MKEPVRVLIVDDEEEFATTLSKVLARRGFLVQAVHSGDQALNLLKNCTFHVVLLDVKMPQEDGIKLIPELKDANPMIQVILMTGHISPEEESAGKGSGAFAYLLKPHPIDSLVEVIMKAAASGEVPRR